MNLVSDQALKRGLGATVTDGQRGERCVTIERRPARFGYSVRVAHVRYDDLFLDRETDEPWSPNGNGGHRVHQRYIIWDNGEVAKIRYLEEDDTERSADHAAWHIGRANDDLRKEDWETITRA